MCLIKDIFLGEHNIIKYELQNTVDLYRNSLNKNPALFQNLDMYFIKEKIDELLIIREEQRKYNKIVIEAKEALRKVRTNYPFLM